MAGRIRTVKPELNEDQVVGRLSHEAFRLFVVGIAEADDHGNLRADPDLLAAKAFWGRPMPSGRTMAEVFAELDGLWQFYEVRGQRYAHYRSWHKHQRISNAGEPRVPLPPGWVCEPRSVGNGAGKARAVFESRYVGQNAPHIEVCTPRYTATPGVSTSPLDQRSTINDQRSTSEEAAHTAAHHAPSPVGGRVVIVPASADRLNPRAQRVLGWVLKTRHLFPSLDEPTLAGLARDLEATAAAEVGLGQTGIRELLSKAVIGAEQFASNHTLAGDLGVALALKKSFWYCIRDEVAAQKRERERGASRAIANGKAPPAAPVEVDSLVADADASEAAAMAEIVKRADEDAKKQAAARELAQAIKAGLVSTFVGAGGRPAFRAKPENDHPTPPAPSPGDEAALERAAGGDS
jgi:hypothetical protein